MSERIRMRSKLKDAVKAAVLATALQSAPEAHAQQVQGWDASLVKSETKKWEAKTERERFMITRGTSPEPMGYRDFREWFPEETKATDHTGREKMQRREVSDFDMLVLRDVNRDINTKIQMELDQVVHGMAERWVIPIKAGDCEDLALLKRKILIEKYDWQPHQLLMAVTLDGKGEGHAVLIARTAKGDFVLDNKRDSIDIWSELSRNEGYQWIMRQSFMDPNSWLKIVPLEEKK